ncbi:RloB family protein [Nocardia terpenica]|nr:RloB family protein [Nocardia terpenica]
MPRQRNSDRLARSRRSRTTDLNRRTAIRERNERYSVLIYCEGKTEKNYFTGMRTRHGPQIDVVCPEVDHVSVVREAGNRATAANGADVPYNSVWCVLDTELDADLVKSVREESGRANVSIAFSCPSFELWLILHLDDYTRPFQTADEAKKALRHLRPGWSEQNTCFADFKPGLGDALARARNLDPSGENPLRNPSSGVWRLVELITPHAEQGCS